MKRRLAWAFGLLIVLAAAPAHAQSSDASRRAVALGYEGDGLYARGRWDEAYQRFAEAEQLAHSPVFVLYMARCKKNAGRLLEARALYERVARDTPSAGAPKPFRDAITDSSSELAEMNKRIASVKLAVTGAPRGEVTVSIDGAIVSESTVVELDPGPHDIAASSGQRSAKKHVTLAEGAHGVPLALDLAAPAQVSAQPPPSSGSLAPGFVALSIGILGIGAGAVTGVIAAGKASDVESRCAGDHCLTSDAAELDTARTLATVSTVGFVAGGVALAAAGVLFIARPGKGSAHPATSGAAVSVRPSAIVVRTVF